MTLRTRIAAVASLSVALAVLAAAIGLYVAVRSDLRGEIDSALRARAQAFAMPGAARRAGRRARARRRRAAAARRRGAPPGGPLATGGAVAGRQLPGQRRAGAVRGGVGLRAVHLAATARSTVPGGQGSIADEDRADARPTARSRRAAAAAALSDRTVNGHEAARAHAGHGRRRRGADRPAADARSNTSSAGCC